MRITRVAVVAGLPAQLARDLLRAYSVHESTADVAARVLSVDQPAARRVLQAFEQAGYLEPRAIRAPDDDWWIPTIRGDALAMATFAKPITRATAERQLSAVIDRARL